MQAFRDAVRGRFAFRLSPLLLLVGVGYLLLTFGGLQWKLYRADNQILALEQQKELILEEQQSLIKQKEKLDTPVYLERRAREALGFIKPGEKVLLPAKRGEVMTLKTEGIDEIGD